MPTGGGKLIVERQTKIRSKPAPYLVQVLQERQHEEHGPALRMN